ncbi:hypothetical protein [Mycobacterium sp. shizuoka-1]|uniref:hypothetical protein n=1 Tax=Mycobacterium sp. shizuoka-1 TaxID=2039281 RepID=UPI000C05E529|nr:hypothetical protein [Mycobacterium sp. shizuoka-1]GAY17976.1 hypothetical protein MSZK_47020 [Mycobacterium sp. shizuoka-1]
MSVVRVNFLPEFHFGDDAVLLTVDGDGLKTFMSALEQAMRTDSSQLLHDGVEHQFHIEPGTASAELSPGRVVWRLDAAKAAEIADDLAALSAPRDGGKTAGHFYVDMTTPADTLVISRDEYTDITYPWVSPPQTL